MSKNQVIDCVRRADIIEKGCKGRKVAQKGFDAEHVLRVVFAESGDERRIITLYPGRRDRYEDQI